MSQSILPPAAVDYPSSDGKPLAENDAQLHAILYAVGALWLYYRERTDVYVSGDLLIYYEEGNPRVSVAPDAFVVFGVEDRMRMNYKVWKRARGRTSCWRWRRRARGARTWRGSPGCMRGWG